MTTPVKDIITTLRYSMAKCWHMPKPATLTMHPVGFKCLRDYLLSSQASVHEKMALEPARPAFDGMRIVENPLLADDQFVVTDRECNILAVGRIGGMAAADPRVKP